MLLLNLVLPYLKKFKWFAILVVVAVLTYFVARRWRSHLPPWYICCAITVGSTAIVMLLVMVLRKRHEKKMSSALEAGIAAADEDKVDLKGEIKALRENWQNSLASLKSSRLGEQSKATLFRLPWYIIIGEPASGKSTLLRKSGLDFPVGDASVAGLHGTRNCDWWFANEAIFLDTAGRYVIESQEQEWTAFLTLLQKYRTKKPINGVLVALPANSLLTKSHDDLLQDGKRIRNRIDELIDGLGINFPIYVLVTKCDLVSGFVEFFGNLDRRHGEQMVGWTNPQDSSARFDGETFDKRFEEVNGKLFEMRPWLESQGKKRDLMKAFLYPEEFSYLGTPVRTVLDVVFRPNVYQETPVCRGVYFSSGTQVGSPLALALDDMARDLGISSDFGFGLSMEEEKEVRAYFIKDLVAEQVLKDREMNWRTWHAEAKIRKRRMGWGLVGVAVALFLALFITKSFIQNQGRLSQFKVSIPEGARPLEAATGCLKTRDEAVPPGVLDLGLNYSDELIPSMDASFRSVFTRGCLDPMLEFVKPPILAGVPKDAEGRPDVKGFLVLYSRYLYLRDGPPEEYDAKIEEAHLETLFNALKDRDGTGRGTKEDLRYALREYGGLKGNDDYRTQRREIEAAYIKALTPIVVDGEAWVAMIQKHGEGLEESFAKAISKLKENCSRYRSKIAPHDTPKEIVKIAEEIRKAASPHSISRAGQKPLTEIAGVTEPSDLAAVLNQIKAAYPAPENIPEDAIPRGGHLPKRIDAVVGNLGQPMTQDELKDQDKARTEIVKFLDKVIAGDDQTYAYDKPTRDSLGDRREEITEELRETEEKAWAEIRHAVAGLEEDDVEEEDKEGNLVPKKGWWNTLPLLARARLEDVRKEEYLTKGLTAYLSDDRWQRERSTDREEEIYRLQRLSELVIPAMREQVNFFHEEFTALSLRDDATDASSAAVTKYLDDMRAFWTDRFKEAIPHNSPESLGEVYDQLSAWDDKKSDLRRVCFDIEEALYGITEIDGPDDDPILEATFEGRRGIFETFVVCFNPDNRNVSQHSTVTEAANEIAAVSRSLDNCVDGLGTENGAGARQLVAKIYEGAGRGSTFAKAMEKIREFSREGSSSEPAKLLAEWLVRIMQSAWDRLVKLTAEDINRQWAMLSDGWRASLGQGDPIAFKRIFGDRSGEIMKFYRDYVEPFFKMPGYVSQESDGATMVMLSGFRDFANDLSTYGSKLFTGQGGIRQDSMEVSLKIAGKAPVGLKLHYQSNSGTKTSDERRTDEVPVTFNWSWSPTACESFSMEVFFRGNNSKKLPRMFTGKWAVAEALAAANEISGNTFIWKGEEPNVGDWEIHLTFTSGGPGALYQLYRSANGQNPLQWILSRMPDQVVEVRDRRR
jgi:IcmF-related N-terminal domain